VESHLAYEKLRSAYAKLVAAKAYRIVTTACQPSGTWAVFTYLRQKAGADDNLLRMDTVNYDASGKVLPHLSRTYITNKDGDWEMSDFEGSEEVAFHLTGESSEVSPMMLYKSFITQSHDAMDETKSYSASPGTYKNLGVEIITESSPGGAGDSMGPRYAIDPSTGALVYWSMQGTEYQTTIETDPDISSTEFVIPEGKIVTNSPDPDHDRGLLFSPEPTQPTPADAPRN
jgi:hypothetical protein